VARGPDGPVYRERYGWRSLLFRGIGIREGQAMPCTRFFTRTIWPLIILGAFMVSGCVVVCHDEPTPMKTYGSTRVDHLRVEGFALPITVLTGASISHSYGTSYGYGSGGVYGTYGSATYSANMTGSHSSTTTTYQLQNTVTNELQAAVVKCLENRHIIRVINGPEDPDLILRGAAGKASNSGLVWTIPFNIVTVCGLVLPITWGEEYSATIRVYTRDNLFLREYSASSNVRSWYHWAWWVRLRATNERISWGAALASRAALADFVEDLDAGKYEEYVHYTK